MKKYKIGDKAYPIDNSYCFNITKGTIDLKALLAGTAWTEPKLVQIVSNPYIMEGEFLGRLKDYEFITVYFEGDCYSILNILKDNFDAWDHDGSSV